MDETRFIRFWCRCGEQHTVWEWIGDEDSLEFRCENGEYYKKMGRIPTAAKIAEWREPGNLTDDQAAAAIERWDQEHTFDDLPFMDEEEQQG